MREAWLIHLRGMRETRVFNRVHLGIREARFLQCTTGYQLGVGCYQCTTGYERGMGFTSVHLGIREARVFTV